MKRIEKILIIACIILIAGIGITSGMLIESENKQINQNSLENQSVQNKINSSVNNASKTKINTNKTIKSQKSGIMSTDEAYSLMKKIVRNRNGQGYSLTPPALISRNMIYHSSAYYGETGIDANYRGFIQIDSTTGEIIVYSVN